MYFFYIHHGDREIKDGLSQDNPLTRLGVADAKLTAKTFNKLKSKLNIKAIYTSEFLRCKQTAQIINKKLKVPIFEDARLNEFKSVSGETWLDCQNRTISLLKEILMAYDDTDCVICVTSGVNLTAFIDVAYNLKPNENLPFPVVPMCSSVGFNISKDILNHE